MISSILKARMLAICAGMALLCVTATSSRAADPRPAYPFFKTYNVTPGQASKLAELLNKEMKGQNQFRLSALNNAEIMVYGNPTQQSKVASFLNKQAKPASRPLPKITRRGDRFEVSAPDEKKPPTTKPGEQDAPITITPLGNRIIISSKDKEALRDIAQIVRALKKAPDGAGDFVIRRLKYASATEAAKVLDEVFNGKRQQQQSSRGGFSSFFSRFSGGSFGRGSSRGGSSRGGSTPTTQQQQTDQIRVVADPGSNSLLIKASPLDLYTIDRLLRDSIDSGKTDSLAVSRTYMIGPLKYASAADVAEVVGDVFREYMNENPRNDSSRGGFSSFFSRSRSSTNRNVDANGNPRAVTLSIGTHELSNSLIVQTNESLYKSIKELAEDLDERVKNTRRVVRIMDTPGLDPYIVQQVVDAIQGKPVSSTPTNTSGIFSGGSSRFGGGSTSPFSRFGGGSTSPFSRFGGGSSRFGGGGSSRFGGGSSRFGGGSSRGGRGGR